LLMLDAVKNHI